MADNSRLYNKPDRTTVADGAQGTNLNPGPYEAVVKDTDDPTRSGRLKVYVPDLGGGDQEDPSNWVTVSYCSPFMGKTYRKEEEKSKANDFRKVEHTYGFWAVPPDRGNTVLVIFVNGDRGRGYWIGCVMDKLGHHMIPSIGGGKKEELDVSAVNDEDVKKLVEPDSLGVQPVLPMSEFNETNGQNIVEQFSKIQKPVHEYQAKRYAEQGLDRDEVRGARFSSGQRETTSAVFGWSTPGRPLMNDPKDNPDLKAQIDSGEFDASKILDADGRKGGHSFVMDDGAFYGGGEMVRIRSAEGHQILMDDQGRSLYMINADGTVWVEMAGSGHLSIYTSRGFNLRAKEDINIHSDASINMFAGKDFNIKVEDDFKMEAENISTTSTVKTTIWSTALAQFGGLGMVNITAGLLGSFNAGGPLVLNGSTVGLNSGPAPIVIPPFPLEEKLHSDTSFENGRWEIKEEVLESIVTIAPTHEPWVRTEGEPEPRVVGQTVPSGSLDRPPEEGFQE